MARETDQRNSVKSLVKALNILKLYRPGKSEWTVGEMAKELGYHKSSIQRLVTTLEAHGFLERTEPPRSRFALGPITLMLGHIASQDIDLRSVARPHLQKLVDVTGETAHLCVVDQSQCYYLDKIDSGKAVRIATYVGQRLHLHCSAVGKTLLSGMTEEEVDRVISDSGLPRFTDTTITDRESLRRELDRIRESGCAYDNEEYEVGLRCVAAPVKDNLDRVVAAISLAGPVQRFTTSEVERFAIYVREAAAKISKRLGHMKSGAGKDPGSPDLGQPQAPVPSS
ncbi:MAG: IclR family transcriptional regulator [Thermodesulfobacteriota bacterium]